MVYKWIGINQWLWPTQCIFCRNPGRFPYDICAPCLDQLPRNLHACVVCALPLPPNTPANSTCGRCLTDPPSYRQVLAPFLFETPINTLIADLKFTGQLRAGRVLGDLLAAEAGRAAQPQALIPVPLHPARLRSRGFNQAREIALRLARTTRIPLLTGALRRNRDTPPQSGLDRRQRLRNLRVALQGQRLAELNHVAVVDDVVTTGATANAVARELRRCGVATVDIWAVARTPE